MPNDEQDPKPTELTGEYEPVPEAWNDVHNIESSPIPFGNPPEEKITVVGEVPWELRDEDSPGEA